MTKIIISYRRSDSDLFAGRIRDRLASTFGEESIFIDVDNIPLGKDFRVHIQEEMSRADAVLVVIGPNWLGINEHAQNRIMQDTDPVRIEVETALHNRTPIIPILFGKTPMPQPEQLPPSLKDFAYINAASVDTGRDFHRDLTRVIETLTTFLKGARRPVTASLQRGGHPSGSKAGLASLWAIPLAIGVIIAVGGSVYWLKGDASYQVSPPQPAPPQPLPPRSAPPAAAPPRDQSGTPVAGSAPAVKPAALPSPRAMTIRRSQGFGGTGGAAFDDAHINAENTQVSGLNVVVNLNPADTTQQIIGSLQAQWGDTLGPLHGGKGPYAQAPSAARFAADERIGRVDINSKSYHFPNASPPPLWIAGIAIWTDTRVYKFGDMTFGPVHQCILEYGEVFLGFFGRSGSYIDQVGCIIGKPK